jgi:hypothetical protein
MSVANIRRGRTSTCEATAVDGTTTTSPAIPRSGRPTVVNEQHEQRTDGISHPVKAGSTTFSTSSLVTSLMTGTPPRRGRVSEPLNRVRLRAPADLVHHPDLAVDGGAASERAGDRFGVSDCRRRSTSPPA